MYKLTDYQLAVVERPLTSHIFLRGPAGTGKSTAGAERLKHLLSNGVAGDSIPVSPPTGFYKTHTSISQILLQLRQAARPLPIRSAD